LGLQGVGQENAVGSQRKSAQKLLKLGVETNWLHISYKTS
jgi:hypothetical protein